MSDVITLERKPMVPLECLEILLVRFIFSRRLFQENLAHYNCYIPYQLVKEGIQCLKLIVFCRNSL